MDTSEDGVTDKQHDFDDDGCCTKCGFDGAEWHWWKHDTYEGRASDLTMPKCSFNALQNNLK